MSTEQPEEEEDILVTAEENPDELSAENVVKLFEHDQGQTRNVALMTLSRLATDDPDRVVDQTEAVIDRLDDEFPVAQSTAAEVLSRISPEYPERVKPAIPRLVEMLDQDPPLTGHRAGRALVPLLAHAAEDFVEQTDELLGVFDGMPNAGIPTEEELEEMNPDTREEVLQSLKSREDEAKQDIQRAQSIREFAVQALVEVTDLAPERVGDRVVELRPIFFEEPPIARVAAMDVVANVAQHDQSAVEPVVDDLITIAESDTTQIRAHAIQALGYAGATRAAEPLREVAASDDDAITSDLSELATETAEFLDAQE